MKGAFMLDFSDIVGDASPIEYFLEISKIPRPSGHTEKIADYLVDFARKHGLEYQRDEHNNVVIRKPATSGKENSPTVIIQGHTDIVAVKDEGVDTDMTRVGVECYRDGDFLRARGTSLGADDGVAVAYALALLASKDVPHPPLEALFTSDEETGLIGATKMDGAMLNGRMLINIDSDEEGIFTVGCAGGARCDITLPVEREDTLSKKWEISIFGLLGGHSGMEIDKGRVNAIATLAKIAKDIPDIRLISLSGGVADNAIPTNATARLASGRLSREAIDAAMGAILKTDAGLRYSVKEISDGVPMTADSTASVLSLILSMPTGVIAMSEDIPGLVETSANIGIATTNDKAFSLTVSVRSAKDGAKRRVLNDMASAAKSLSAEVNIHGEYPAWEYRPDSALRDVMCKVYKDTYGKDAEVLTIHAGLECGIFTGKIPELDCLSLGPNNYEIHTTKERLSISSFIRVYEYLKAVLREI